MAAERVTHKTSLVAHWLRLQTFTLGSTGLIPGQGTKIPHAACTAKKKKSDP